MVYRGKPSTACARCRSRRLKCDRQRPSCSSCLRVSKICTGYRDLVALSFEDQTDEVVGKARRRHERQLTGKHESSSRSALATHSVSLATRPISAPIKDDGISYVLTYYLGQTHSNLQSHLSFLRFLLQTSPSVAITASINAMGLASLANIHSSPRLMLAARQEYSVALSETSAVLADTRRATSDSTLAAILMLGLYEVVTCDGPSLTARLIKHLDGATKLIELRGPEQLRNTVGLDMFLHLRSQFTVTNICLKRSTPSWLRELSQGVTGQQGPHEDAMEGILVCLAQVSDLCGEISSGPQDSPTAIICRALQIDAELVGWSLRLDSDAGFSVVYNPATSKPGTPAWAVYDVYYHVYPGIEAALLWNTYRLTRIVVHELIVAVCERLCEISGTNPDKHQSLLQQSVALTRQLARDICASIGYIFQTHGTMNPALAPGAGLFRLVWALYVSADCSGSSPDMKEWIIQCLQLIGRTLGVRQALYITDLLRHGNGRWITPDFKRSIVNRRLNPMHIRIANPSNH
ncbi:putative Zn(II)2Cys6 transcription factor [Aspergillus sclerotiicarbonarius CBS 121057]|uniref:Putative Zn(II)2Cys6 transcription factor n=1 Tax=Aspergillus sclerotiicarbonarius (strain CBS 121057 / IBT 28362) TaxID=1448318 RepID=A0A319DY99_ASPSB|nr:putative Zn(II)2Cys6 transcription factor [Aspergillus sclerotiicarbonarius CBS 121057]